MTPDDDQRYVVIDGRRWRATDPAIPEPIRKLLVAELMDARRRVHLDRADPDAVAAARRRVHDAKVALGERGDPWWQPTTEGGSRRLEAMRRALRPHLQPGGLVSIRDLHTVALGRLDR